MTRQFLTALLATVLSGKVFAQYQVTPPVVDLGSVKYRGNYNDTLNINEFLGVPFAAAPVGSLRWKPPQPYVPTQNTSGLIFNATQPGASCVQGLPLWTGTPPVSSSGSEDCLFLNIYTPGNATVHSNLPVIFSIHGGGYVVGDANLVPPQALMRHSKNAFVFVSIQYRLGAYGFLGSEQYVKQGGAANVGLLDQRFAMEWAQKNIEAFGGDPAKVTILGGSAGGGSVTSHMIWKGGVEKAPFRAAVADFPWWQQLLTEEQLEAQFEGLLAQSNCSTLTCLQDMPEEQLKATTQATYSTAYTAGAYGFGNFYYGPYVDGDLIRDLPSREFKNGHFTKVPTWVSREGYEGYSFSNQSMTTVEEETSDIRIQFPGADEKFVDELYQLYPAEDFNSTFWQRQTWFGDFTINCPTYYVASTLAASDTPVFKQVSAVGTELHGSTGPYLADLDYASEPGANVTLANVLRDWYVSFAIHGDPNAESWSDVMKPVWPDYKSGEVMSVNYTQLGAVNDAYYDATARCKFLWENNNVVQNKM